jgi:hypothetical protein
VTFTFEGPLNTAEGRQNVQAFQESLQIVAGAANIDKTVATLIDWKKATKDAVRGTQAPADWFNDEQTQQDAADQPIRWTGSRRPLLRSRVGRRWARALPMRPWPSSRPA